MKIMNRIRGDRELVRELVALLLWILALCAALFLPGGVASRCLVPVLSITAVLLCGKGLLIGALEEMKRKRPGEKLLMCLACGGALVIGEFCEGAAVAVLYCLGETLQDRMTDNSREALEKMLSLESDTASVIRNGREETVSPDSILPGELTVTRAGERIALDGIAEDGGASVDISFLTGESMPADVRPGDRVYGGSLCLNGVLYVRVEKTGGDSAAARIRTLMEQAQSSRAEPEKYITRFAKVYTPCVVMAAALILFAGGALTGQWRQWFERALAFLTVSCPCALLVSVPLAYISGIGAASREGVLVRGAAYMDRLSRARVFAFDKTGTLTDGELYVEKVLPAPGYTRERLLRMASAAESGSSHPAALCIRSACPDSMPAAHVTEEAGLGVTAETEYGSVCAGSARMMRKYGIVLPGIQDEGTAVHIAVNRKYAGRVLLGSRVKDNAAETVSALTGMRKGNECVILSGDTEAAVAKCAEELGIRKAYARLSPEDKVDCMRVLCRGAVCVYAGDGINDAPVLETADIGFAMGLLGSDAAKEAADIVVTDDDLEKLVSVYRRALLVNRIVKENTVFALFVKACVLILSFLGAAGITAAVLADTGVCLLCALNALRAAAKNRKRAGGRR